jgi:hypothetical protein
MSQMNFYPKEILCQSFATLKFVYLFLVRQNIGICEVITVKLGYNEQLGTGKICSL